MKTVTPLMIGALVAAPLPAFAREIDPKTSLPPTPVGNAPSVLLSSPIEAAGEPTQRVVPDAVVPQNWWHLFDNAILDGLVEKALHTNNDIATADAALRQAQALAKAAGGGAYPQLDAGYQAQRARVSNTIANPLADAGDNPYTLHTAQLTVSYTADIFGGVRAKTRSAEAAARAQAARKTAAVNMVVANLVQAVIQNANLDAQISATNENIAASRDVLSLLRKRQQLGVVGAADVVAQETVLAAAENALPSLERARLHQEALITILMGDAPGNSLPALPKIDDLKLPASLPLALPSDLLRHRPDIRAAGAVMEGAAADVRVAIAARLPSITLNGNIGGAAGAFGDMFATGNPFWSLIGGITAPLFHGGALRNQQHASEAALDGAKAQYRTAALQAFVDVSDALTALKTDADALDAAKRGDDASAMSLSFARRQLELGGAGTLNVLVAQSARAQARAQLVLAKAARLNDTVAFFQAVGGASATDDR